MRFTLSILTVLVAFTGWGAPLPVLRNPFTTNSNPSITSFESFTVTSNKATGRYVLENSVDLASGTNTYFPLFKLTLTNRFTQLSGLYFIPGGDNYGFHFTTPIYSTSTNTAARFIGDGGGLTNLPATTATNAIANDGGFGNNTTLTNPIVIGTLSVDSFNFNTGTVSNTMTVSNAIVGGVNFNQWWNTALSNNFAGAVSLPNALSVGGQFVVSNTINGTTISASTGFVGDVNQTTNLPTRYRLLSVAYGTNNGLIPTNCVLDLTGRTNEYLLTLGSNGEIATNTFTNFTMPPAGVVTYTTVRVKTDGGTNKLTLPSTGAASYGVYVFTNTDASSKFFPYVTNSQMWYIRAEGTNITDWNITCKK